MKLAPSSLRSSPWPSRRIRSFLVGVIVAGCTPVSQSFEVHSAEISCEEANRYAYDSVVDQKMKVTSFTQAKPGRPGYLTAVGGDRRGNVRINCDENGIVIDPTQSSMGDRVFERGVFLSVTGRSGLRIDRGDVVGRDKPIGDLAQLAEEGAAPPSGRVQVQVQPQRGFEAVLDFDADLAAAGILPVQITISNGSKRAYVFAIEGVILRARESGDVVQRLTASEAAARLQAKAGSDGAQSEVGNVASATKIMAEKELKGARLGSGDSVTGYVYYPVTDYERAKIQMTDVAAGEIESFLVDF